MGNADHLRPDGAPRGPDVFTREAPVKKPTRDAFRHAAKRIFEDEGKIDFDDKPKVSKGEEGAYVQTWVWVSDDEARGNCT